LLRFLQWLADFRTERFGSVSRSHADDRGGGGKAKCGQCEAEVCEAELEHYRFSFIQNRHGRETLPCSL
jgi:hypothetical protein